MLNNDKEKCMSYYYINSLHTVLHSIAVTLHWNPFGPYRGTLVMFVFLFFLCLSPLVSWIDFPFVLDSRDAQCWFQFYGSCFIACSVFVYGGIPQFHSAHKRIPSGRAYPSIFCSSTIPEMDQANIWSLTQKTQVCLAHTYTQAHMYTTSHYLHTQYLLLYHIAANPVKKLCGEKK